MKTSLQIKIELFKSKLFINPSPCVEITQNIQHFFQILIICLIKLCVFLRVNIQHTNYFFATKQWNNNLRFWLGAACNMSFKFVNILHNYGLLSFPWWTTNSLSFLNLSTCQRTLEWTQQQEIIFFRLGDKIESDPPPIKLFF